MSGLGLGLRLVLACKMDKNFLRDPLVLVDRQVHSEPMDSIG